MSEALRLYKYKSLLSSRRAMSPADLMAGVEVSKATFKRDIAKMRDQMHMPIRFDRDLGGYILDQHSGDTELPGLWFSPDEILALVTIQQLLAQLEPGLLGRKIKPLQGRLVHYRDNWYVDAWCHLRNDLRNFSIDAIPELQVLDKAAKAVTPRSIDEALGAGYGIFGGAPKAIAVLKFTKERARWVSRETWHPQQESHTEADGSYILSVPYSDDREIVGDIMRFGADVQVLEPAGLRKKVHTALLEAVGKYV